MFQLVKQKSFKIQYSLFIYFFFSLNLILGDFNVLHAESLLKNQIHYTDVPHSVNLKKNYDTEIKWAIKHNKLDSLLIYILRQEVINSANTSYLQTVQRLHQYQNKIEFLRSKEKKLARTDTLYAKYLLCLA
ncbi:MAG: hypothetical protein RSC04_01595, partial [Bacteroidales bacterium]